MSIVLKNNASDFLAAAIDSSQTTITLESAASFPTLGAGEYFYGTIESTEGTREIVRVNARVGNTLTVVRGQDGTSAVSFAQGSRFEARINAASVEDKIEEEVQELRDDLAADDGGTLVGFKQTDSNAVATTVQHKLRESVSPLDFGAIGDGVANDTAAVQAALSCGKPIFDGGSKVYRVTSTLLAQRGFGSTGDKLIIHGKLRIKYEGTGASIAIQGQSTAVNTYLSTATRPGRTSIVVNSAVGMNVNDIIQIKNNALTWPWEAAAHPNFKSGEVNRIRGISGTTITLWEPLYLGYPASTDTVITTYRPLRVDIEGLSIDNSSNTGGSVSIFGCADSVFKGITVDGPSIQTTGVGLCHGVLFDGCRFINANESGLGYGVMIGNSTTITFNACYFSNNRRGVDFSGSIPVHNGSVIGCTAIAAFSGQGSNFGSHACSNKLQYHNNVSTGSNLGIQCRSPNNVINGNSFGRITNVLIFVSAGGLTVTNNSWLMTTLSGEMQDSGPGEFLGIASSGGTEAATWYPDPAMFVVIENNHVAVTSNFLGSSLTSLDRFKISNNSVRTITNSSDNPIYFIRGTGTFSRNSWVKDNYILPVVGTFEKFESGIVFDRSVCDWVDLGVTSLTTPGVVKHSGAGTLDSVTYNYGRFMRDSSHRMRLIASITFVISGGSAVIKWDSLSIGQLASQNVNTQRETSGAACSVGFVSSNSEPLFIGNDASDPTVAWDAGTYTVLLDVEWEFRLRGADGVYTGSVVSLA